MLEDPRSTVEAEGNAGVQREGLCNIQGLLAWGRLKAGVVLGFRAWSSGFKDLGLTNLACSGSEGKRNKIEEH